MKKFTLFGMIVLFAMASLAFTPQDDIDLRNYYNIINGSDINATNLYQDGNAVLDTATVINDANYSYYTNSSSYWDNLNTPLDITSLGNVSYEYFTGTEINATTGYFKNIIYNNTICTASPEDNRAGIQTCLDSVGVLGGGIVQLLSGEYEIDMPLNISYDHISLIGEGWATILKPTFGGTRTHVIINPAHIDYTLLKDFKIDSNDKNASISIAFMHDTGHTANYTTIDYIWIENSRGNPILTGGAYPSFNYFTIKNSKFTKDTWDGGDFIDFSGEWGIFDNNILISTGISNSSQYHIMFTSGTCYNCRITNNYIESTNCSSGITLETFTKQAGRDTNFHSVLIANNILKNSQIKLSAHSPYWSYGFTDINIIDNEIWNNGLVQEGGSGINFHEYVSVEGLRIAGNQIYNPYIGINIPTTETYKNVQVHDNLIIDSTSYPLSIHCNSANSSQNYQIHDNMIIDNIVGISLRNSTIDNMAFYNNIITGNQTINTSGATFTNSSFKDEIFKDIYPYKLNINTVINGTVDIEGNFSAHTPGSDATVRIGTFPGQTNYADMWREGYSNYMIRASPTELFLSSESRAGYVYIRNANYNAARFNETQSYFYGNTETPGTSKALEFDGAQNWTDNQNYPAACPSGSAITQLNDSVTCTDSWVDIDGDTMTGNLTISELTNGSVVFITNDGQLSQANDFFYFESNGTEGKLGVGASTNLRNILQAVKEESTSDVDNVKALITVVNTDTTDDNWAGYSWQTVDADGDRYSGARIMIQFTNHSNDSISGDMVFDTRHNGARSEKMRLDSDGSFHINGSVTTDDYFYGQPITGGIESGILYSSETVATTGNANITINSLLEIHYPDIISRIVSTDGTETYCELSEADMNVTDDQHTVYYFNSSCDMISDTFANYFSADRAPGDYARLFDVYAIDGTVEEVGGAAIIELTDRKERQINVLCASDSHLSVCEGLSITTDTFPSFNISSGHFVYINSYMPTESRASLVNGLHLVHHTAGDWTHTNITGLNITHCDNGTDLVACDGTVYRQYPVYSMNFNTNTKIHQLSPLLTGTTYTTLAACKEGVPDYTLPSSDQYVSVVHHIYCARRTDSVWDSDGWIDLREGIAAAGGIPDLSIYLTKDGTRELTSNWDVGSYDITAEEFKADSWTNVTIAGSQITSGTVDEDRIEDKFAKNYGDEALGDYVLNGSLNIIDGNFSVHTPGATPTIRMGTFPGQTNYADVWREGLTSYMIRASTTELFISSGSRAGQVYIRNNNYNAARFNETEAYFYGETKITGIKDDGAGKVVCIKSDGNLGTCTDTINATGYCTCT